MSLRLTAVSTALEQRTRIRSADLTVWLACVGFAVLLGMAAWLGRGWAAPLMVVAVLALGALLVRLLGLQVGLVILLIVTCVVERYTFRVGSLDVRAEQIGALVVLASLVVIRLRDNDWSWIKPSVAEWILAAWLAANAFSSVLASPDRKLSAKIIVLVAISALGFALPRRVLNGSSAAANLETITRWLLVIFVTESAWGAFTYLFHVFGPTISLGVNPASGHLSDYGTLWEQNVFGAFAAAGAVAWAYVGPSRFRRPWAGIAVCLGGLLDSFTRAAWLAAALVGAIGLLLPSLRRRIDMRTIFLGALATLPFVAATLAVDRLGKYVIILGSGPKTQPSLLTILLNVVDVVGRVNQIGDVRSDIHGRLIFGRGTASYGALHLYQGVPQHLASLPLAVLHDTGIVGVILFAAFVVAVVVGVWSQRSRPLVVAYGQVGLLIGLTNLATETTELMVGWMLIGLLMAAADHAAPQDPVRG